MTAPPPIPAMPGYRDLEPIARSETALVFRAIQTRSDRKVAIKVLAGGAAMPEQAAVERAVLLSSQPDMVTVVDTGVTEDGRRYVAMDLCDAGSYAQLLQRQGQLPVSEVLSVCATIAEALHAGHRGGVVHGGVGPANIMRTASGAALSDYPIARTSAGPTHVHYAAPEALTGEPLTGAADLYALAATLWHLLAGRPPFSHGTAADVRDAIVHGPVPAVPRDDVPEWLHRELARAMAKRPADRHSSTRQFAAMLRFHDRPLTTTTSTPDSAGASPAPAFAPPASAPASPSAFTRPEASPDAPTALPASPAVPRFADWSRSEPVRHLDPPPVTHSNPPPPPAPHPNPVLSPATRTDPAFEPVPPPIDPVPESTQATADPDRRRGLPVAVAVTIAVICLAGGALTVGLRLAGVFTAADGPAVTASTIPSSTAEVTTVGAPRDVHLVDNGTTIALNWTDPTAGTVQFVVLGGVSGERPTVMGGGPVKPGQTAITLYGINPGPDYCFVVAALYGANTVATSTNVCTRRHPAG